jgi:hypothetical protein
MLLHRIDRMASGVSTHRCVRPARRAQEVDQPLVHRVRIVRRARRARRDRLHALALAVGEQAQRVHRKRCPLPFVAQVLAQAIEVIVQRITRATLARFHLPFGSQLHP